MSHKGYAWCCALGTPKLAMHALAFLAKRCDGSLANGQDRLGTSSEWAMLALRVV